MNTNEFSDEYQWTMVLGHIEHQESQKQMTPETIDTHNFYSPNLLFNVIKLIDANKRHVTNVNISLAWSLNHNET